MGKVNKNINRVFKRQSKPSKVSKVAAADKDGVANVKQKTTGKKLLTKKEKRLQRKSSFITKLSASKEAKDKLKKAKQRAQTVIVGDMNPLLDALTDIAANAATINDTKHREKCLTDVTKKKKMPSEKHRQKSDLKDIDLFKRVTTHPKYVSNPINAITDHVKYLIQLQESNQM